MKLMDINSALKWARSATVGDVLPWHALTPAELARVLDVLVDKDLQFGDGLCVAEIEP